MTSRPRGNVFRSPQAGRLLPPPAGRRLVQSFEEADLRGHPCRRSDVRGCEIGPRARGDDARLVIELRMDEAWPASGNVLLRNVQVDSRIALVPCQTHAYPRSQRRDRDACLGHQNSNRLLNLLETDHVRSDIFGCVLYIQKLAVQALTCAGGGTQSQ